MRFKKVLAVLVTTGMLTGCAVEQSKTESTVTEAVTVKTTEGKEKETHGINPSQGLIPTKEATTTQEADETQESTVEDSTGSELPTDDGVAKSEKYRRLLALSIDEARDYFGAEAEEEYTSDDFVEYIDNLYIDYLPSIWMDVLVFTDDPSSLGIDESELSYMIVNQYEEDDGEDVDDLTEEIKALLAFPYDKLTTKQQIMYETMYYNYIMLLWQNDVTVYYNPLTDAGGFLQNLALYFYDFELKSEKYIDIYHNALAAIPDDIDVFRKLIKKNEEMGFYASDNQIDDSLSCLEGLCEKDGNPFIEAFDEKIDVLKLDKDKADEYKKQNEELYFNTIIPEFEKLKDELSELKGKNDKDGTPLCDYDGGLDYYELLFEDAIGLQSDIDTVFSYLSDKVKTYYEKEMYAYLHNMDECDQFFEEGVDLSDIEAMSAEEMIAYSMDKLSEQFPSIDYVKYLATPLPKSLEIDGVLAYYKLPYANPLGVNQIRYNESAKERDGIESFFTTICHEGYPGHMLQYQSSVQGESYDLSKIFAFLGTTEGWAMYIERYGTDLLGMGEGVSELLKMDMAASGCYMGMADIAYNAKGWTPKELNKYFDGLGLMLGVDYCEELFETVTYDPANYLSYSVGMCLTEDLINDYVAQGHSLAEAHADYLKIGIAPFEIMKKYIGRV